MARWPRGTRCATDGGTHPGLLTRRGGVGGGKRGVPLVMAHEACNRHFPIRPYETGNKQDGQIHEAIAGTHCEGIVDKQDRHEVRSHKT